MMAGQVFHEGEVQMQNVVFGAKVAAAHREAMAPNIREYMPAQHVEFFEEAPWLVAASLDADGWPRASVLQRMAEDGPPLFSAESDARGFAVGEGAALPGDALLGNLGPGRPLGLLGIELSTRRRNRVNGFVRKGSRGGAFHVDVQNSFGNCPKYIASREMTRIASGALGDRVQHERLSGAKRGKHVQAAFAATETFFIASGNQARGVDASHRGGPPGFVKVEDGGKQLAFPDYVGNGFFNTLGNIMLEPRVGLLVVDFATGTVTQVQGRAEVLFEHSKALPGSERVVRVAVTRVDVFRHALAFEFGASRPSPFNPPSSEGEGDLLEVAGSDVETHDTKTIYFRSPRPIRYRAGQFASFRVHDAKSGRQFTRAWTLSTTPPTSAFGHDVFGITVKRKAGGAVSPLLHDERSLASLEFRLLGVEGDFTLPRELDPEQTFIFAAAGSGITPVMSMLRFLSATSPATRATVFIAARKPADWIFQRELCELLVRMPHLRLVLAFSGLSTAPSSSSPERLSAFAGRLTAPLLAAEVPAQAQAATAGLFICGPGAFARDMEAGLAHVPHGAVHVESFDF